MKTAKSISDKINAEAFWAKVSIGDEWHCWPWTAYRNKRGYGVVNSGGATALAHRVAYTLKHGVFKNSVCVLHRCDNPCCCNPNHLFLGTQIENMKDMQLKGREHKAKGDRNGSRTHPERLIRGDAHPYRKDPSKVPLAFRNFALLHPERLKRGDENGARKYPERISAGIRKARTEHPEWFPRGERVNTAILTAEKVKEIRAIGRRANRRVLAAKYGVSTQTIKSVILRKSWRHIP